ncbi:CpaF family protein [Eubacterium sp. MSJ-33]|uniref:CpaF family protein n=1 Tax=Eubacterium sp. MSJ-33 TaxID=2841528 RepID=UPI001C773129|nr:CpaF family protein [Eubacterium sp. MSJ-33]QWT52048.1 CpaF family protein [Eubacterium sp. MSJ-33]
MELQSLRERLKMRITSELDLAQEMADEDIARMIDRCIAEETKGQYVPLKEKVGLRVELFNSLRRLDVLTELLEDESVTEIMVNSVSDIFVERGGTLTRFEKGFSSEERLEAVIQHIVGDCNRRINAANPIVDARLVDGSRVCVVTRPISLGGPIITIRRFPKQRITMEKLIAMGSLDAGVAAVLQILVQAGYNIFISGGTGSGKTTMLNALSDFVPKDARIVTIEDSAELQIQGVENLVRMEARMANLEGENEITIRDLIKASLRLRPDRIIVGEVRDAAAIDMLQAMNSGHDGSLSTGHANSAEDMLTRLETMVLLDMEIPLLAVRRQIASAVDIVIHVSRLRDKSRKVIQICEVNGMEQGEIKLNSLFEFRESGIRNGKVQGMLHKIHDLMYLEKLQNAGLMGVFEEAVCGLSEV